MQEPAPSLRTLVQYYLRCLEVERRHEAEFASNAMGKLVFRVQAPTHDEWRHAFVEDSQALSHCARVAVGKGSPVMFAVLVRLREERLRPVAGVFGRIEDNSFQPDPQNVHVASPLDSEMPEDQLVALRDALERAVRSGPTDFVKAVRSAASDLEIVDLGPTDNPFALEPGSVAFMPCLMVIEAEVRYDRGLVSELTQIGGESSACAGCALAYLFAPRREVTLPTLDDMLRCLASPLSPTFAQAEVLAFALHNPLVTVTGPPGTGKTLTIVAMIVEALLRNESVLLASKINFAVDAAVALADRLLGPLLLRTGSETARATLALKLANLSNTATWPRTELLTEQPGASTASPPISLDRDVRKLRRLSQHLAACHFPLRWWNFFSRARARRFGALWEKLTDDSDAVLTDLIPTMRTRRVAQLRQRLDNLLASARPHLSRLSTALSAGTRERHRCFETLVQLGFPIAVTNLAVSSNLPLRRGVFDLLIVDEASACDPASLIPLLYRAKRAVIVGDPHQLTHIFQRNVEQVVPVPQLRSAGGAVVGASFSASSFHLASQITPDPVQRTLLDHFRCPPPIIRFSSRRFYGGILRIRTSDRPDAIATRAVDGPHETARGRSKTNRKQVEAVCDVLQSLRDRFPGESLGVVTPWRAFKEDVRAELLAHPVLSEHLRSNRLIADTAHGFQGTEVDNVVFATVLGDDADTSALSWLENPNLFNVAITRARKRLIVVGSRGVLTSTKSRLLRFLVTTSDTDDESTNAGGRLHPLGSWLQSLGLTVIPDSHCRGFPVTMHGLAGSTRWSLRLLEWDELKKLSSIDLLRMTMDKRDLEALGIKCVIVPPVESQNMTMRWLAREGLVPGI
ncbi:MAG: hypothetical protein AMXMBFR61_16390 [Fimbriimonadales bacterium]